MCRHLKFIQKKWRQQGAILAFTALLLPMIIVGTGLAVDLGNIYVQYSRLQNAADAAALAGAHEYAVQGEKVNSHPEADKMAEKYVQGDYHNLDQSESIADKKFQAQTKNKTTYYRVKLTKEVPLYFLGSMYQKISGKNTFTVPVASVAAIQGEADVGGFFNNMFIFTDKFSAVNSINNPDKLNPKNENHAKDSKGMIITTFDGRVVYTKGDGVNDPNYKPSSIQYSTQYNIDRFFTTTGQTYNQTHNINELVDNDEDKRAKFGKDGALKSGYWSQAEYYNYDFQVFYNYMKGKLAGDKKIADKQDVYTSDGSLFGSDVVLIPAKINNSDTNPTIYINGDVGISDKPIYMYIEPNSNVVNIKVNTNNNRPLIICIGGSEKTRRQVHMDLNGHTFKGVVYAPYCDSGEGILVNANNGRFIGTIVGASINLQGGVGYYEYKDFMGNNGSSSNKQYSTDGIALVSPPEGMKWD